MPLEYTYSFLILLQILPKGHDGESSPARCAPENACHRLRARPAPPPDEVPSRAALLNPPPAPGPPVRCAETRRSRLAALRRNEICMRGIPVQNKGGTASFASPLFGGGGAFLFVFARTRKAPPPRRRGVPRLQKFVFARTRKAHAHGAPARRPRNPFFAHARRVPPSLAAHPLPARPARTGRPPRASNSVSPPPAA